MDDRCRKLQALIKSKTQPSTKSPLKNKDLDLPSDLTPETLELQAKAASDLVRDEEKKLKK